ncbi:unnamed protein product [Phytophthora lilii]|uniref:Unnamed protein product n=1 Tax=Phytophthora lilii TaxID=2077276 RepID=A0A9W6WSK2_9STRA|nr:unnamed protein product [Phytophthora lilii]
MFDDWDITRTWSPFATFEQTMKEFDRISDRVMRRSSFPFKMGSKMLTVPGTVIDNDEFFRDLPIQVKPTHLPKEDSNHQPDNNPKNASKQDTEGKNKAKHPDKSQQGPTFSCYSISTSTSVDNKGQQVMNTHRRYEDSSGRLKAVHERQMEGKTLRKTWNRQNKSDEVRLDSVCSSGTPDEFEAMWDKTPFGRLKKRDAIEQQKKDSPKELKTGDHKDKSVRSKL